MIVIMIKSRNCGKKAEAKYDNFIVKLIELVEEMVELTPPEKRMLHDWGSFMLKQTIERKQAFYECYGKTLKDVCLDIRELASDYDALFNKTNKAEKKAE